MKIYALVTVVNGYYITDMLSRNVGISGLITLKADCAKSITEYYDYSEYCRSNSIKCIQVETYGLSSENDKITIAELDIDLLIVVGWQRLIPSWLIKMCSLGVIGGHGSPWGMLQGRGRSPQNWALILGKEKFEASIFWISDKADEGRVIESKSFFYSESDDINTSYVKYSMLITDMLIENLNNGRIQNREGLSQDGDAAYLPKRTGEDGKIDWNRSAKEICNFVRALTRPYPGAFSVIENQKVMVWSAKDVTVESSLLSADIENGNIVSVLPDNQLIVKCKRGLVLIDSYSPTDINIEVGKTFVSEKFSYQMDRIIERHISEVGLDLNCEILSLSSKAKNE